jgi:hypothetical protein
MQKIFHPGYNMGHGALDLLFNKAADFFKWEFMVDNCGLPLRSSVVIFQITL